MASDTAIHEGTINGGGSLHGGSPFPRLFRLLKSHLVSDVPEEIALCEFDCRKSQCEQTEWDTCARRIRKAAGELFPEELTAGN